MVLAALAAHGETMVTDVRYIERGYDRFNEKLRSLGANIEKIAVEERRTEDEEEEEMVEAGFPARRAAAFTAAK
jgi:hypothetical protein